MSVAMVIGSVDVESDVLSLIGMGSIETNVVLRRLRVVIWSTFGPKPLSIWCSSKILC